MYCVYMRLCIYVYKYTYIYVHVCTVSQIVSTALVVNFVIDVRVHAHLL